MYLSSYKPLYFFLALLYVVPTHVSAHSTVQDSNRINICVFGEKLIPKGIVQYDTLSLSQFEKSLVTKIDSSLKNFLKDNGINYTIFTKNDTASWTDSSRIAFLLKIEYQSGRFSLNLYAFDKNDEIHFLEQWTPGIKELGLNQKKGAGNQVKKNTRFNHAGNVVVQKLWPFMYSFMESSIARISIEVGSFTAGGELDAIMNMGEVVRAMIVGELSGIRNIWVLHNSDKSQPKTGDFYIQGSYIRSNQRVRVDIHCVSTQSSRVVATESFVTEARDLSVFSHDLRRTISSLSAKIINDFHKSKKRKSLIIIPLYPEYEFLDWKIKKREKLFAAQAASVTAQAIYPFLSEKIHLIEIQNSLKGIDIIEQRVTPQEALVRYSADFAIAIKMVLINDITLFLQASISQHGGETRILTSEAGTFVDDIIGHFALKLIDSLRVINPDFLSEKGKEKYLQIIESSKWDEKLSKILHPENSSTNKIYDENQKEIQPKSALRNICNEITEETDSVNVWSTKSSPGRTAMFGRCITKHCKKTELIKDMNKLSSDVSHLDPNKKNTNSIIDSCIEYSLLRSARKNHLEKNRPPLWGNPYSRYAYSLKIGRCLSHTNPELFFGRDNTPYTEFTFHVLPLTFGIPLSEGNRLALIATPEFSFGFDIGDWEGLIKGISTYHSLLSEHIEFLFPAGRNLIRVGLLGGCGAQFLRYNIDRNKYIHNSITSGSYNKTYTFFSYTFGAGFELKSWRHLAIIFQWKRIQSSIISDQVVQDLPVPNLSNKKLSVGGSYITGGMKFYF